MVGALDVSDRNSQRGGEVVNRPIGPQDVDATGAHAPGIGSRGVTSEGRTGRSMVPIEKGEAIRGLVG